MLKGKQTMQQIYFVAIVENGIFVVVDDCNGSAESHRFGRSENKDIIIGGWGESEAILGEVGKRTNRGVW